ncbi:substrate-binding domain-containing protein [Serpens gallinarum]|uniref:Substrate-binding domain-containing protein n=1 Tax=Serpens gallinarum TaxID=2763075 RepID=A0ABR8TNB6_9PSED|nr:phosphate ABC transporter substrate-binding/OmpA family protein [Serpens gallinarum]MBD7977258.1 substrate-binding domain-containing protein [Serpens gallinarum]
MPRTVAHRFGRLTRTFCVSLALCGCVLPSVVQAESPTETVLRIQGSNTIGAKLAPALVEGLFQRQGLRGIRTVQGARANEQRVVAYTPQGRLVQVVIAAHGSSTGFTALHSHTAELAASSRPVKDSEVAALAAFGDLRSASAEQVIAIDGLAIIVHPKNPLQHLDTKQLAAVFAGELNNWSAVGGAPAPITLYARDDQSGTYDTFKELVLNADGRTLGPAAQRFESNDRLAQAVLADRHGIGFVGLASVGQSKALLISNGEGLPLPPNANTLATEDYPLSRRLFIYNLPGEQNPWAQRLIDFAHGPQGQAIVENVGFISQNVRTMRITPSEQMPVAYRQLARQAQRLSVNFRFQEGSAQLDNKALRDIDRIREYLRAHEMSGSQVTLVGFGDAKNNAQRADLLSRLRAMAVRRELRRNGVVISSIVGIGDEMPVAANDLEDSRLKNRRVEVWVNRALGNDLLPEPIAVTP